MDEGQHGGRLYLDPERREGARFILELPMSDKGFTARLPDPPDERHEGPESLEALP